MQGRREDECKDLEIRQQAHRLWEDQRKRDEALRTCAENKRREMLAMENRIKDIHRVSAYVFLTYFCGYEMSYNLCKCI